MASNQVERNTKLDLKAMWSSGIFDFVSVVPPRAKISANSSLDASDAGKVPGKLGRDGWHGYAWKKEECTKEQLKLMKSSGANIGIRGDRFPSIDIDVLDEELADDLSVFVQEEIGTAPIRVGKPPKLLLFYSSVDPIPSRTLLFSRDANFGKDAEHYQIDFIGAGRQFVAYGIHPGTMKPYTWNIQPHEAFADGEVYQITDRHVNRLFQALQGFLEGKGWHTKQGARQRAVQRKPVGQDGLTGDYKAVRSALRAIPSKQALLDYDERINVLAAIAAALQKEPDKAVRLARAWWKRFDWDSPYNERMFMKHWNSLVPPYSIGANYIFDRAFELGKWNRAGEVEFTEPLPEGLDQGPPPPKISSGSLDDEEYEEGKLVNGVKVFTGTEDGIAVAFVDRYQDKLRHCSAFNKWFLWTGNYWKSQETPVAFSFAVDIGRKLKWNKKAATAGGAERIARADPKLAITVDKWDVDNFILGTKRGTVDLRTGEIRKARQGDYITKIATVAPDFKMKIPIWKEFLKQTTQGDTELQYYIQQICGYILTGSIQEHALFFVYGSGGNGKGVFMNAINQILGDYAVTAPMETFQASRFDQHPTEIASFKGSRVVIAQETEEGRYWAESRIKMLTGGDVINARFMRQDSFQFAPTFKIIIVGNHIPQFRNVDEAIKRRINILPFENKPKKPDFYLGEKLKEEYPGILAWMIRGCLEWQAFGLIKPQCVIDMTKDYIDEQDTFANWVKENCDVGEKLKENLDILFSSYRDYCLSTNVKSGRRATFTESLRRAGFKFERSEKNRLWKGLALKDIDEETF